MKQRLKHRININKSHFLRVSQYKMSDCVEIQFDEVSFPLKSPFPKRVTTPSRLVDKCAEAAVARNVTPRKTLARERAQNKINECYSRLFCSFLSVIFIHIIRNVTKLKCLCGEHLRDNCVVLVGPACSQLIWKCGSCQSSKMGISRRTK